MDASTSTVVNIRIWEMEDDAKQMETLAAMLAQRPILEAAGVQFEKIADDAPVWKIEGRSKRSLSSCSRPSQAIRGR